MIEFFSDFDIASKEGEIQGDYLYIDDKRYRILADTYRCPLTGEKKIAVVQMIDKGV